MHLPVPVEAVVCKMIDDFPNYIQNHNLGIDTDKIGNNFSHVTEKLINYGSYIRLYSISIIAWSKNGPDLILFVIFCMKISDIYGMIH